MGFGTVPYGISPYGVGGTGEAAPIGSSVSSTPPATSIPHFRIPFAIGENGSAQTVQQGTVAEIVQSVSNLIGTTPDTRYMVPSYGLRDPTFEGIDPVTLRQVVAKWEPRATATVQGPRGAPVVSVRVV